MAKSRPSISSRLPPARQSRPGCHGHGYTVFIEVGHRPLCPRTPSSGGCPEAIARDVGAEGRDSSHNYSPDADCGNAISGGIWVSNLGWVGDVESDRTCMMWPANQIRRTTGLSHGSAELGKYVSRQFVVQAPGDLHGALGAVFYVFGCPCAEIRHGTARSVLSR